jgi:serine phosphatase RsbU (regulator of sigma subunit)/pSer/pThr/pTyr-binding forkhead associated (FHA) protein
MNTARLEVRDGSGLKVFALDKPQITIGRKTENDVRLTGSDVSRDHAEIVEVNDGYVLRDRGSRYGTFVNDAQITEHHLQSGDRIQFGRAAGTDVVFLTGDPSLMSDRTPVTAVSDLRQLAALLEGLRALGSGRVLDEVLALVLDAAIEVTSAERGFIMLAGETGLEMKLARARGRITLPGNRFDTSRKIPEEVFATGTIQMVRDLIDNEGRTNNPETVALGIRQVACAPLRIVRFLERADLPSETRVIGVLYLDSRERGTLTTDQTKNALDTLATEAGVAIENARLYRQTLEKARIEHELRIAAEIQRALLPEGTHNGPFYEASGTSVSARTIGGDFYDLLEMADGSFAFLVGDVSGKGPAAALLTSKILGIFSAFASSGGPPSETIVQLNRVLTKRAIGARYATTVYGRLSRDGTLDFCSAGHNPALVLGQNGLRRLDASGMPVGLFENATYDASQISLQPGDTIVLYSDGVTEAQNRTGDEFGEARLVDVVNRHHGKHAAELLSLVITAVQQFAHGAEQSDDITALIVRYTGPGATGA